MNYKTEDLIKIYDSNNNEVPWQLNRFPDGQVQTVWTPTTEEFRLVGCVTDPDSFLAFLELWCSRLSSIGITYLYGARSDKLYDAPVGSPNLPFNLGTELTFPSCLLLLTLLVSREQSCPTTVLDPHCNELIQKEFPELQVVHSFPFSAEELGDRYGLVVYPDESAQRRYQPQLGANPFLTCEKVRDQSTGRITGHTLLCGWPKCFREAQQILVVDDICDGGATFISVAELLKEAGIYGKLDLSITHGVFSKGVDELLKHYNRIYVTDSHPGAWHYRETERILIRPVWNLV